MSNDSVLFPNGPEEYIEASQKKMKITVALIIIVMIATVLWSFFGYINVTKKVIAVTEQGVLCVLVTSDLIDSVGIGTRFTIDGVEYTADFEPFEVYHPYDTDYSDEIKSLPWVPEVSENEYLSYFGIRESPLPTGWYVATIQINKSHPIDILIK